MSGLVEIIIFSLSLLITSIHGSKNLFRVLEVSILWAFYVLIELLF